NSQNTPIHLTLLSTFLISPHPLSFSAPRNSLQFPIFQLHNTTFDAASPLRLPTDIFTPQRITPPLTLLNPSTSHSKTFAVYIDVTVKLGVIKLLTEIGLCEEIKAIDRECPLKRHQECAYLDIPREVPRISVTPSTLTETSHLSPHLFRMY
ncbi:hypothetical protein BC829DRAFT_389927, partial [Chytridium lagenaria]